MQTHEDTVVTGQFDEPNADTASKPSAGTGTVEAETNEETGEITVSAPKANRKISFKYEFGADLDAIVAKYGKEAIYEAAVSRLVVALQNIVRSALERGESDERIAELVNTWEPGKRMPTNRDPVASFKTLLESGKLDQSVMQELLAALQSKSAQASGVATE